MLKVDLGMIDSFPEASPAYGKRAKLQFQCARCDSALAAP